MALPSIISEEHIARLTARRQSPKGDVPDKALLERRRAQEIFLGVFEKTFSVQAAEHACETIGGFQRWKATDPDFCLRFNQSLGVVQDSLSSHALVRARGYRATAPDGTPLVDGDGTPIYRDGSDKILMAILGLDKKEESVGTTVTIEIVSKKEEKKVLEHQPEV
jgi:hypothetical protein